MTQQAMILPAESGLNGKISPTPGTSQIAGFVEFCPLMHSEKVKEDISGKSTQHVKKVVSQPGTSGWAREDFFFLAGGGIQVKEEL